MSVSIREPYGPYPKNKEKKRVRFKEGQFFKRTYEWLKWKITNIGGVAYHTPCLEQ
jgi:hypothetical protein